MDLMGWRLSLRALAAHDFTETRKNSNKFGFCTGGFIQKRSCKDNAACNKARLQSFLNISLDITIVAYQRSHVHLFIYFFTFEPKMEFSHEKKITEGK